MGEGLGERGKKSEKLKRMKYKFKKKTETESHKGSIAGKKRKILRLSEDIL